MDNLEYKYQAQLMALKEDGVEMPQVNLPNNKQASRFVFSQFPEKNHLPVCVSNPKRILPGPIKTSGYALSCFGDTDKAKERYKALQKNFKQIHQTIGDSMVQGVISNEDGRITTENNVSHFDLYEFKQCDLNKSFTTFIAL